jgi:hypothetical protein
VLTLSIDDAIIFSLRLIKNVGDSDMAPPILTVSKANNGKTKRL